MNFNMNNEFQGGCFNFKTIVRFVVPLTKQFKTPFNQPTNLSILHIVCIYFQCEDSSFDRNVNF